MLRIASTPQSPGAGHASIATTARAQRREFSAGGIAPTSGLHCTRTPHAAIRRLTTWRRAGHGSHKKTIHGDVDASCRPGAAQSERVESGADHAYSCLVSMSSPPVRHGSETGTVSRASPALHDLMQIFHLTDHNGGGVLLVVALDRRGIDCVAIDGKCFGDPLLRRVSSRSTEQQTERIQIRMSIAIHQNA